MKTYLLPALLLFCSSFILNPFSGNGQDGYQRNDSVAKYYFCTNKAELAIVDSNYTVAISFYKRAFQFKSPNPRDISNGLRLALILKDTQFARKCFDTLAINGMEKDWMVNAMGEDLTQTGSLYDFLAKDYDSLLDIFNHSNKLKLAAFLDSIMNRDQKIRQTNYTDAELAQVDQNNIDSLIWFIHHYGFPDFHLLGFAGPMSYLGTGGIYWFLLWHNRNMKIGAFDSLGLKAVMKGAYPPCVFAQAYDFKTDISKYHMLVPGLAAMQDSTSETLPDSIVNKYRSQIYLESMADYKKKLLYMKRQGKNWFLFLLTPQMIFGMNFAK